jgi:hypothetical protein
VLDYAQGAGEGMVGPQGPHPVHREGGGGTPSRVITKAVDTLHQVRSSNGGVYVVDNALAV